jgi:predicted LPLAT superfamily acyltransferase
VPRARLYGRYATHVWVWINTLSLEIRDTMCGFRVYPLRETMALLARGALPPRMDFDTEVMVRLHWRGVRFVAVPTRVTYPVGGRSHFRLLDDNLRISWMHTRLFGGMLLRLPMLLWRKVAGRSEGAGGGSRHWASIDEGTWLGGILFLLWIHRWFGRWPFRAAVFPVVLVNWLLRPAMRRASLDYLRRIEAFRGATRAPGARDSVRHVMRFADTLLDKLLATAGRYPADDVRTEGRDEFYREVEGGPGAVIVTAHVGCLELCQHVAKQRGTMKLNILVHTVHAEKFNRLLKRLDPHSTVRLIEVSSFGPATAVSLAERVAAGECIVIAGDRVPLGEGATATVPFLGAEARFPIGPYVLANVLQCPVFGLFCIREDGGYVIHFDRLASRLQLPRADRAVHLAQHARAYVDRLTAMLVRSPLDWFNFFDFWKQGDGRPSGT